MDPQEAQEIVARIDSVASLDTEQEVAALETDIVAAYRWIRETDDRSDEGIAALGQLADGLDSVRARREHLVKVSQERVKRLTAIDKRVTPEDDTSAAETEDDTTVAASAGPTPLHRLAQRRPSMHAPRRVSQGESGARIVTPADVELNDLDDVARMVASQLVSFSRSEGQDQATVASVSPRTPREWQLRDGADATEVLTAAAAEFEALLASGGPEALVAGGGVCGPVAPYFDQQVLAGTDRPIANSLPGVGARGGIRFVSPPKLKDALVDQTGAAVGLVTNAQDVANTQKTSQPLVCGIEQTVLVDAVYHSLRIGNAQGRFQPELVRAWVANAIAAHARRAEQRLLTLIDNASIALNGHKIVGAARDLFHVAAQAAAGCRSRNRMAPDATLQAIFPAWVVNLVQADIALTGYVDPDELFDTTAADVASYFRTLGIEVTFSPDSQVFGAQGGGGVLDFPDTCVWRLFPPGSFVHLDGGTLDLGVVRDSTLNADNRYQIFGESWETVAFVGHEAWTITSNVCASGQGAVTLDTSGICSGAAFGS